MNSEYSHAVAVAKENLTNATTRGNDALGESWEDIRKELLTPEERTASNLRVAIMEAFIKARNEQGISQRELEQRSGVKQPIISRMETGATSPQLDTLLKLLRALGKTLQVCDITDAPTSVIG